MSGQNQKSIALSIIRFKEEKFTHSTDVVVRETPVTLFLNHQELVTLVCSPGELRELAVGFLCAEGMLQKRDDLKDITVNESEGLVQIETFQKTGLEETFLKRFIASGCGRSRASFYFVNDARDLPNVVSNLKITPREIFFLTENLENKSSLFRETGGVHSAALCTREGVIAFYEDIGRHNAVDKITGKCLLENIHYPDKILVFSGRISSEILIKVAKMGIPLIISRSAPTELAVNLAQDMGITVIGFAREGRFNIYTHPERVVNEL
jgi:FdhD protein